MRMAVACYLLIQLYALGMFIGNRQLNAPATDTQNA